MLTEYSAIPFVSMLEIKGAGGGTAHNRYSHFHEII